MPETNSPTHDNDIALASDFPAATEDQWRRLVDSVLKGASFDTLKSRTADGLVLEPLYPRDTQARPLVRQDDGGQWDVLARIDHHDPEAANAQAQHDLGNGASGLSVVCAGAVGAYGFGLADTTDALRRALDGMAPRQAIEISPGPEQSPAALLDLVVARGDTGGVRLGFDPIGVAAASGTQHSPIDEPQRGVAAAVADVTKRGFAGRAMAADGRVVHDAGGTEAQELAFAIACAVAYLRALKNAGLPLDAARRLIFFRLAADTDQFLTIAKHRALRMLWARVEEACGLTPAPAFISTQTAWRMMTARGTHVNILRATLAVFAGGVGGADAITVLPHTMALGLPDGDARRLARNIQLLLMDETHLAKVADPAAGAGATERLTQDLCAAAWTLFQEIERQGGAWTMMRSGDFARQVATARVKREAAIAQRRDVLTGLSEFADLTETRDAVLLPAKIAVAQSAALPPMRLAEPFERLRDASDSIFADTGARPRVFLATLGGLSEYGARAAFAKGFFEAGGIAAVSGDGVQTDAGPGISALTKAFTASGAQIACLCGSEDMLAREGAAAAAALVSAGARHIYAAATPGRAEGALRQAGIGTFVHAGCDARDIIEQAYAHLASAR